MKLRLNDREEIGERPPGLRPWKIRLDEASPARRQESALAFLLKHFEDMQTIMLGLRE